MEIHPKFQALFSDSMEDKRYYQVYGGRGSGKSFAVATCAITKTYSEFGHRVLYLRKTMTSSEDSTIADVRLCIEMMDLEDDFSYANNTFTNKKTGGTITFKGIYATGSQTAKLKSLSNITTMIVEEAEELSSFEEFSKIDEGIRVAGKPLKVILVYNPGSALQSFIHSEWFLKGQPNPDRFHDTEFIHSTYKDNIKNLNPSVVKRYEDLETSNPTYYRQVILAEWTLEAQDRVYEGWGEIENFEPEGDVWYGLDFGYGGNDETSCVRVNYFEEKYYVNQLFSKRKMRIDEIVFELRNNNVPPGSLIIADSAVPEFITQIKIGGFTQVRPCKKGHNSKEQGIKKLQELPIIMVGMNPNLYFAYNTFSRKKNGELPHEPDTLAALRYALTYKNTDSAGKPIQRRVNTIKSQGYL